MIIARARGRLGNQLFYLSALSKARNVNELVLAIGFEEFSEAFPFYKTLFPWLIAVPRRSWAGLRLVQATRIFSKSRLVGEIRVDVAGTYQRRTVWPSFLWVLQDGYYQDGRFCDEQAILKIRNEFLSKNSEGLVELGLLPVSEESAPHCFVHVRRGDYLEFPHPDFPAALPGSWFLSQIEVIRKTAPDTKFIVFSDDPSFCSDLFHEVPNLKFVDLDVASTFTAMSLCQSAIISPSSLSWWGAKLASLHADGPFIAPNFWFWWAQENWNDDTLRNSDFLTWARVRNA